MANTLKKDHERRQWWRFSGAYRLLRSIPRPNYISQPKIREDVAFRCKTRTSRLTSPIRYIKGRIFINNFCKQCNSLNSECKWTSPEYNYLVQCRSSHERRHTKSNCHGLKMSRCSRSWKRCGTTTLNNDGNVCHTLQTTPVRDLEPSQRSPCTWRSVVWYDTSQPTERQYSHSPQRYNQMS
jgi:hypothetical protein